jgi:hypothetical protein
METHTHISQVTVGGVPARSRLPVVRIWFFCRAFPLQFCREIIYGVSQARRWVKREKFLYNDKISQKQMNRHITHRLCVYSSRVLLAATVIGALLLTGFPQIVEASTWSPTLLVNTESFQVIDQGDGTTDIEIRFGNVINERFYWDISDSVFRLTDDLTVEGTLSGFALRVSGPAAVHGALSVTGALTVESTISGASLVITDLKSCDTIDTNAQGQLVCGTDASGSGDWSGTGALQTAFDNRYVNQSGDTMTGALTIDVAGEGTLALSISGALIFNESGLNNDARFEGDTDANLFFLDASTDRIGVGTATPETKLDVTGTISGAALRVSGPAEVHGALTASGSFRTDGNITINDDQTAADAVLTFGKSGGTETFTFSNTNQQFELSDALRATGNITTEGTLSGTALRVSGPAAVHGALSVTGALTVESTISGASLVITDLKSCDTIDTNAQGQLVCGTDAAGSGDWSGTGALQTAFDNRYVNQSGDTMTGNLIIGNSATLSVSGAIITEGNLTINEDNGAADAVLTFGNDAGAESLIFSNTFNEFELSDDLRVTGNLSSSGVLSIESNSFLQGNVTVGGTTTLNGVTYTWPGSQGGSGTILTTDSSGNLSWTSGTTSSGSIVSLMPEYDGAVYFSSGSSFVGQLVASGSVALGQTPENFYRWTTTKTTNQDYWISSRVRIPNNFVNWDPIKPIEFRYRGSGGTLDVRLLDTADARVTLTGGDDLTTNGMAWSTATITGPQAAGTYSIDDYITLLVKMTTSGSTLNDEFSDAGFIQLNWETRN